MSSLTRSMLAGLVLLLAIPGSAWAQEASTTASTQLESLASEVGRLIDRFKTA